MKSGQSQGLDEPSDQRQAYTPLKNGLVAVGKILLFLGFAIHAFNVDYAPITGGPDPSWQYVLNYAFDQHQDFTYPSGPLGFINYPMDVGRNLGIAVVVRFVFWVIISGWFGYFLLKNTFPLRNLAVFVGLFALGSQISIGSWSSFRSEPSFGAPLTFDYMVCFVVLFLLSHAFCVPRRWLWCYSVAIGLSACLGLMKVSAAILTSTSCVMFSILVFFVDRRKSLLSAVLSLIGIPLIFSILYLIYEPSISQLFTHVKRSIDISSGFNVVMSLPGQPLALWLALAIAVGYGIQSVVFFMACRTSGFLSLLYLPALFSIFKHGFVRQDGHETIFFLVSSLILGLLWLFTPITKRSVGILVFLLPVLITRLGVPPYSTDLKSLFGIQKLVVMHEVLHYNETVMELNRITQQELQGYRLPPLWREAIGKQVVTIFPWEAAFVPANDLNYHPFPIIQSYSAYTAYLDMENARFLAQSTAAPGVILMQWIAMDSRHALLDVPGMWLELYRWYDAVDHVRNSALLRRRAAPRFQTSEFLERRDLQTGDFIDIPLSQHPVLMEFDLELTLFGKFAKLFFKVPEVRLEFLETAGRRSSRIVPETLANPLLINALPVMLQDVSLLMNASQGRNWVYGVRLSGTGLPLYKKTLQVEFYEIPEVFLAQTTPDLNQVSDQGTATAFAIEKIFFSSPRTDESHEEASANTFLIIQGWALDEERHEPAGDVYIEIDGQWHQAYYGLPLNDSGEGFQQFHAENVAFQAMIPTTELGKGEHALSLKILTQDRQRYYSSPETIRFEIQ